MVKFVPPSVYAQSFNCPRCGALAHQTWYYGLVGYCKNNSTHISTKSTYEQILENNENKNIPEDVLEYWKKLSEGQIFLDEESSDEHSSKVLRNIHVSLCQSCGEVSIWAHDKLLFPTDVEAEQANTDMPDNIRKDFEEARSVLNSSPKAAAALLRLCVEKICDYLKADGKDLYSKIGDLVAKGMSARVQKALDSVRVIGNNAVHPGQIDLNDNRDVALSLFKLVNQIILETITNNKHLDDIFNMLPDNQKRAIEERDKKRKDNEATDS